MKPTLLHWIGDADALRHMDQFRVPELPIAFGYQLKRKDDLYIALVGELFDHMREDYAQATDWARLGNALAQYATPDRAEELVKLGISRDEAAIFSASAFYFGGFPASAFLIMRSISGYFETEDSRACSDLLARPAEISSTVVIELKNSLLRGDLDAIAEVEARVSRSSQEALSIGPQQWIPLRLQERLIAKFRSTNLRAVLPNGKSEFWTPLITSLVNRGTWDFFPSQIDAIERGILEQKQSFSLQMPTGAGKTALCETLLFSHLSSDTDAAAVLIVPYRSLASELRKSLVRRLNEMGISSRCAYGGTVPSSGEVHAFDDTRALVATPETLSGILSANVMFANRISLVICDEGHLLDAPTRGIGLELLLARMKIRGSGNQRFVFVSAIVPNIEEINIWLGGTEESVVRSDYRPALAEYCVLRPVGTGAVARVDLEMHPHENEPIRYRIERFLRRTDFQWKNEATGRLNTYAFTSVKTRAIAAARKALPMGVAVVFTANKRGPQGAMGLAEELLNQMEVGLPLPSPLSNIDPDGLFRAIEYLENEYGENWTGTRALKVGAVLHHGDIPQETREVVENMLREGHVKLGICTSTLAEGVNLPIRTLVLYSVQRIGKNGVRENLLTRDIKSLVGRAGRAGATTKGLVVCANEAQWPLVAEVAQFATGEPVTGALRSLIAAVRGQLALNNLELTNELLERSPGVFGLIDGIDATLIDLAAAEIGEDELFRLASILADQTFASRQTDEDSKKLLRDVFGLRARRIGGIQAAGRLQWFQETGTRIRMADVVESGLRPMLEAWDDISNPLDPGFVSVILEWAWAQPEVVQAVRDAYRQKMATDLDQFQVMLGSAVRLWLGGASFAAIASGANLPVDDLLGIHSQVFTFALETVIEQGIALLEKVLLSQNQAIAPAVLQFPEHLRFGVPTIAGRTLAAGGIRHRRAFVMLGNEMERLEMRSDDRFEVFLFARQLLESDPTHWHSQFGSLVFANTRSDLGSNFSLNA